MDDLVQTLELNHTSQHIQNSRPSPIVGTKKYLCILSSCLEKIGAHGKVRNNKYGFSEIHLREELDLLR